LGNPGKDIIDKITAVAVEMLNWDSKRIEEETDSLMKVYQLF
jgi:hypothetical protein